MHKLRLLFSIITLSVLFFTSCASKKNIHYLQDIGEYNADLDSINNDIRVQKNDLLQIIISSTDQVSAQPFNIVAQGSSGTRQSYEPYLVNSEGKIDIPILGSITVLGKTKIEIINELKEELKKYIKSPAVTLRITNFSISVIGEVESPGFYRVENERINILQAISLAGDMTIFGKRKEVTVVREDLDGKKLYAKLFVSVAGLIITVINLLTR